MAQKRKQRDESRRDFLRTMAAAGGAAAVASVAGTAVAADAVEADKPSDPKETRYKVTPHISTYYKKARM